MKLIIKQSLISEKIKINSAALVPDLLMLFSSHQSWFYRFRINVHFYLGAPKRKYPKYKRHHLHRRHRMRAGSSFSVDDRSHQKKIWKSPSITFYHKAAIKTIHLKVCRHTDIRDPPAECALCHILNQHGNDKRRGFGSPNAGGSWALQGHIAAAFPKAQPRRGSCSGRQRKTCPSIDFLLQPFERL